jgi:hypothetical protein
MTRMEVNALLAAPAMRARPVDPDAALVAAAREEPRAFLALYDRYFDGVLGYCRLRMRDAATCEDVTSLVFTTALAQLGRFRGEGDFAGWLFQIARNAVRDVHRRPVHEPLPEEATGSEPGVEERFLAHERAAQLHALVGLLEPAAVSTAVAAAAFVALIGTGGSTGLSPAEAAIIRNAARGITLPANGIVHVKETGMQNGAPVTVEWWQQTSPPYALRLIKSRAGQQTEGADDGTTSFQYDAGANTILESPATAPPALVDPLSVVREQLANGSARVAGTETIDGASLYKIELPTGVVGYFDRTDYRPMYVDNPQRDGTVVRTQVVTYEELPMTPENATLLSITAHYPDARVDTNPNDAPSK